MPAMSRLCYNEVMNNSKRLYRSHKHRMIAGLCGGVAEYFDIDPTLVRVGLVIVSFLPGPSIIFYLIAWAIVPEEPTSPVKSA